MTTNIINMVAWRLAQMDAELYNIIEKDNKKASDFIDDYKGFSDDELEQQYSYVLEKPRRKKKVILDSGL